MNVSQADLTSWQATIGRTSTRRQRLDVEPLRRFAAAIDADLAVETSLPVMALWAWFLDTVPSQGLGPDGHPRRGDFLPAVTLPRRMFASGELQFDGKLLLDREAEMESRIADVRHRRGESGDLVFVDVDRRLSQDGALKVAERQTLVYREPGDPGALPSVAAESGLAGNDTIVWKPDPVQLFRFSAITFNAHRIHYDAAYATSVEQYPAVVVQGPQTVARLATLAGRRGNLAALSFRAQAPLFVDQPVRLSQTGPADFAAIRCDGVTAVVMKAVYQ